MNWAFQIKPHAGELLSGYLSRVALAHGATPFSFFNLHLIDSAFWSLDIDHRGTISHELSLLRLSGLSPDELAALDLRDWIKPSEDTVDARHCRDSAISPWINATGVLNRNRTMHGLQYCPQCLNENGWVKKEWRSSLATYCPVHQNWLRDGCIYCDAPFVPHLMRERHYRCHICQNRLCEHQHSERACCRDGLDAAFQLFMLRRLSLRGSDKADVFAVRDLASVLFTGHSINVTLPELSVVTPAITTHPFRVETMRSFERRTIIKGCARLMDGWPSSFRKLTGILHLTQRSFIRFGPWPAWAAREIQLLPEGIERRRKKGAYGLLNRLSALEKDRPINWRRTRAQLMIQAASR